MSVALRHLRQHPTRRPTANDRAVLEQSPVDAIAREIAQHGLANRLEVLTADMFEGDWPACDVLLLSNLLHDWDFPECARSAPRPQRLWRAAGS